MCLCFAVGSSFFSTSALFVPLIFRCALFYLSLSLPPPPPLPPTLEARRRPPPCASLKKKLRRSPSLSGAVFLSRRLSPSRLSLFPTAPLRCGAALDRAAEALPSLRRRTLTPQPRKKTKKKQGEGALRNSFRRCPSSSSRCAFANSPTAPTFLCESLVQLAPLSSALPRTRLQALLVRFFFFNNS